MATFENLFFLAKSYFISITTACVFQAQCLFQEKMDPGNGKFFESLFLSLEIT